MTSLVSIPKGAIEAQCRAEQPKAKRLVSIPTGAIEAGRVAMGNVAIF